MTKCIETIGGTLASIRQHSEESLCGSGPQDFRQLTKQLLLALHWTAAMLFRPTGKSLCLLNEVLPLTSPTNALETHQPGAKFTGFPYKRLCEAYTILAMLITNRIE